MVLTCNFGVVFLARNSLGYLGPFVSTELGLNSEQFGLLAAAFSFSWGLSGIAFTALSDGSSLRTLMIWLVSGLAVTCAASAVVQDFQELLLLRLAGGVCSGPILPLTQSIVLSLGSPAGRTLRMGLVQGLGSGVIATLLGPPLMVSITLTWGWRGAFGSLTVIALVATVLVGYGVPKHPVGRELQTKPNQSMAAVKPRRPASSNWGCINPNIAVCSLISAAMVAWLILSFTFYPLYLVNVRHFPAQEMGYLMSVIGIGSLIATPLVPTLAQHLGARLTLVVFCFLGSLSPLGVLMLGNSVTQLAFCLLLGSLAAGVFPLFMAVIPSESVSAPKLAASIGIVQGTGELVGGVAAPWVAGWAANSLGMRAPIFIVLAGSLLATLGGLAVRPQPS